MGVPISNVTRRVVFAASGTGPYAFTFEILANTDIAVYKDDTLLTLTTDYTVTINSNGTGSITLTASPTGATQIAIVGNRTIQRTTDFVTGGDFFANTVNDEMDQQTIFAQQNAEGLQRALQAPQTDPTTINMTLPRASVRASKVLSFDASGNPSATEFIGSNRGNWASGTLYYVRDIVKDTSTSNIWQCLVQHTSSGSQPIATNTDAAKWFLLVDAASAGASATAAAASASAAATSASNASTSATNAASSASSASTSASNASTSATNAANSATAAASSASTASTAATNAGNSATAAASSATSASNSASSASTSATNASNSASAASTSASNAATSATNAANSASSASSSASTATTQAGIATTQATNAASSATAAAASAAAAAASFDAFDDIYLGAKSADPSVDNDGNALTTGDQYFNTSANELRIWNGTTWQAASTVGGTVTSLSVTGNTTLGDASGDTVTINGTATFANANPTLSAGTANGVLYLNGSKVATSGSALTFDGSLLSNTGRIKTATGSTGGSFDLGYASNVDSRSYRVQNDFSVYGDFVIAQSTTQTGTSYNALYTALNSGTQYWSVGGSEQMRLTSTGLGIGTSSPAVKLDVVGGVRSSTTFLLGSAIDGTTGQLANSGGSLYLDYPGSLIVRSGASTERMRLDSSGNLGLGVTPSASTLSGLIEGGYGTFGQTTSLGTSIAGNAYYNSGWKYKLSSNATLQLQDSGGFKWNVAASGTAGNAITFTQAMTLDASGRLSVGTTSTTKMLEVQGSVGYLATFRNNSSTATTSYINVINANNVNAGMVMAHLSDGTGYFGTQNNAALLFATNDTERARIDSSGNLLVGTTNTSSTAGNGLKVTSGSGVADSVSVVTGATSNAGLTTYQLYSTGASAYRFYVGAGGTVYATSTTISAISDQRLKENIQDLDVGLSAIMALKPRKFDWKDGKGKDIKGDRGWIAQEFEQVFPDMIDTWKDPAPEGEEPYKSVRADLIPVLVKAIQELKAEFDAYKATHP